MMRGVRLSGMVTGEGIGSWSGRADGDRTASTGGASDCAGDRKDRDRSVVAWHLLFSFLIVIDYPYIRAAR